MNEPTREQLIAAALGDAFRRLGAALPADTTPYSAAFKEIQSALLALFWHFDGEARAKRGALEAEPAEEPEELREVELGSWSVRSVQDGGRGHRYILLHHRADGRPMVSMHLSQQIVALMANALGFSLAIEPEE